MCPSAPPRFTIRQSFALVWRTLRSMRTALVLLILLAAGAAVGSLLPQIPNSPQRVASYQLAHPFFGSLFLSNRGLYFPVPLADPIHQWMGIGLLAGIAGAVAQLHAERAVGYSERADSHDAKAARTGGVDETPGHLSRI